MKKNKSYIYILLGLVIVLALSLWGADALFDRGGGETKTALICSLVVRCDALIGNETLSKDKRELVPIDGIIYKNESAVFYEGESLVDLLLREMKDNKIHLDFEEIPAYDSVYIKGIGNIYELDCGDMSGWMFKINGEFAEVGCSQYILQEGDAAEWIYSCDLMSDMGFGE